MHFYYALCYCLPLFVHWQLWSVIWVWDNFYYDNLTCQDLLGTNQQLHACPFSMLCFTFSRSTKTLERIDSQRTAVQCVSPASCMSHDRTWSHNHDMYQSRESTYIIVTRSLVGKRKLNLISKKERATHYLEKETDTDCLPIENVQIVGKPFTAIYRRHAYDK